jgi:hypothetical protein
MTKLIILFTEYINIYQIVDESQPGIVWWRGWVIALSLVDPSARGVSGRVRTEEGQWESDEGQWESDDGFGTLRTVALRWPIFKPKKGPATISLGLNYCSMGLSQPPFRDTVPLTMLNMY